MKYAKFDGRYDMATDYLGSELTEEFFLYIFETYPNNLFETHGFIYFFILLTSLSF